MNPSPGAMLQFAREFETDADSIATQATSKAGFDPAAFARYIERTQVDEEIPSAMPLRPVRVQKIESWITSLPARSYSASSEFLAMQRELR